MYEVRIHRDSLKAYRKLDRELQAKLDVAVEKLRNDPWRRDLDIKKLHGDFAGYYRLRVGDVRVIYTVDTKAKVIFIDALSYRGSAYR
ncbi:MAG: type II toxin-antitoxin system RelE family toxin [Desulfotomaculales bacterium]